MDDRKNFNDELFRLSIEADERNLARNVQALEVTVAAHGDTRFCRDVAGEIKWCKAQLKHGKSLLKHKTFEHSQGPDL